jgi:hypothetical protein
MLGSIFLGRIMKSGGVKEQPVRFRFQCASKPCLFVITLLFSPSFLRFLLPQDLLHNCSHACLPGGIPVRHGDVCEGTQCYFHNTGSGCLQEQGCQITQKELLSYEYCGFSRKCELQHRGEQLASGILE